MSQLSSFSILTDFRLDSQVHFLLMAGSFLYATTFRLALGLTHSPVQRVLEARSPVGKAVGVWNRPPHLHLLPSIECVALYFLSSVCFTVIVLNPRGRFTLLWNLNEPFNTTEIMC